MVILKGILPKWSNINGISLFPFILTKRNPSFRLLNHERIHIRQQIEMLVIPFYIIYFMEWAIKSIKSGKDAYRDISFEREAFINESDITYLKSRKIWSWIDYL